MYLKIFWLPHFLYWIKMYNISGNLLNFSQKDVNVDNVVKKNIGRHNVYAVIENGSQGIYIVKA